MIDAQDTDLDPCPGRCNRDQPIPPVPGAPVWCRNCQVHIRTALGEFIDLYAALWDAGPRSSAGAEKVSTSRGTSAPSVSPGADQADEILRTACAWEDALRTHLHHPAATVDTGHSGHGRALTGAVGYLDCWHTAALSAPFAEDYGREVQALAGGARRFLRAHRGTSRLAAPCPSCDLRALEREDGTDRVECRVCGWHTTWNRYRTWAGTFLGPAA